MKIVVLDWNTIAADGGISCSELEKLGDVRIFPMTSPEQTVENIADAEIVLCNKVLITREVMDKCPNIKYIGLFATGFNNIDIEYAGKKNITVCNAGEYSTNAVAQQTFAYILDYFNKIRDYDRAVKNGEWERFPSFSYFPIPTAELSQENSFHSRLWLYRKKSRRNRQGFRNEYNNFHKDKTRRTALMR